MGPLREVELAGKNTVNNRAFGPVVSRLAREILKYDLASRVLSP
jgi:hypothetical protein